MSATYYKTGSEKIKMLIYRDRMIKRINFITLFCLKIISKLILKDSKQRNRAVNLIIFIEHLLCTRHCYNCFT